MNSKPRIGMSGEQSFLVGPGEVIDFAADGMPAVLSTPALVKMLEETARGVLAALLEPGERSVGVELELRHLAPTAQGQSVTCMARVIHVEGGAVAFQLEARDARELIARGLHKRQVIRVERFAQRVRQKQQPA